MMAKKENAPTINRYLWAGLLVLLLGVIASEAKQSVIPRLLRSLRSFATTTQAELPVYGAVADFSLTERSGKEVSLEDLKGKVWIANFIFTHCAGVCPLMTNKMARLQEQLKAQENIRFVSFSVDPENDTPEVLQAYSKKFKADPDRWFFLTGDKKTIYQLSEQHFLLGVAEIPEKEREALDQSVRHSSKFVLVDHEGKIRGYYDSEADTSLGTLASDAKTISAKP